MALALCLVCVCVFPAGRPRGRVLAGARVARGRTIQFAERIDHSNDPSAGSPTETLLRLLLPLDEVICITSKPASYNVVGWNSPKGSSIHPIGRSDGRCVQRAGT